MQDTDVIKAIEAHAADFNLSVMTIGQMAVQSRHAYERIKKGSAQLDTVRRVERWLAEDRAARTAGAA